MIALVVTHAAVMLAWALLRHHNFGSSTDLGSYHAVFWNFAYRGTAWNSIERVNHWSTHLEFGLVWLWLFYKLYPAPIWLFLTQSITSAAAALPIEALARRITGDRLVAALCALSMLLMPQLLFAEISDFHAGTLCVLPIAVIAWGIELDASRAVALGAFFALSLREHMGLLLVAAAIAWVLRHGKRRLFSAIALAVFGLSYFVVAVKWIIPAFGAGNAFHFMTQYHRLGGSAEGIVSSIFHHPIKLFTIPFEGDRKRFIIELVSGSLPLVFLSLRSLRRSAFPLLLGLPLLAVQLYSDDPAKWTVSTHYGAPLVPLIAAASVLALIWISAAGDARAIVAGLWVALVVIHDLKVLPSPVGPGAPIDRTFAGSARDHALRRALAYIPRDASVSAQDDVVPHVAAREEVHQWPDGEATDDFVMLDEKGPAKNVKDADAIPTAAQRLKQDPSFTVLVDEAGVLLVKRIAPR